MVQVFSSLLKLQGILDWIQQDILFTKLPFFHENTSIQLNLSTQNIVSRNICIPLCRFLISSSAGGELNVIAGSSSSGSGGGVSMASGSSVSGAGGGLT